MVFPTKNCCLPIKTFTYTQRHCEYYNSIMDEQAEIYTQKHKEHELCHYSLCLADFNRESLVTAHTQTLFYSTADTKTSISARTLINQFLRKTHACKSDNVNKM